MYRHDPQEFIRKIHDPFEDLLDPRVAAQTLLQALARNRQKDIMPLLMPYIHSQLVEYGAALPQNKNHVMKDAILVVIGSLVKVCVLCNLCIYAFSLTIIPILH